MMNDYYNKYVEICMNISLLLDDDFHTVQSEKRHNKAYKELDKVEQKLKGIDVTELMKKLLIHYDGRVKLNASCFCLENRILKRQALKSLKSVFWEFQDPTLWVPAALYLAFKRFRMMYLLYLLFALFYYWIKKKVSAFKKNDTKKKTN